MVWGGPFGGLGVFVAYCRGLFDGGEVRGAGVGLVGAAFGGGFYGGPLGGSGVLVVGYCGQRRNAEPSEHKYRGRYSRPSPCGVPCWCGGLVGAGWRVAGYRRHFLARA